MTPEGERKADLKAYLATLGPRCWYYMPVPMGYGKRGVPDFLICYRGFFMAPETKREGGKSEAWQEREQAAIRAAGGQSLRVVDVEIVKMWVAQVDKFFEQFNAL